VTVAIFGRSHARMAASIEGRGVGIDDVGPDVSMASPSASAKTAINAGTSHSSTGVEATQSPFRQ
jgi:hypothetical protein